MVDQVAHPGSHALGDPLRVPVVVGEGGSRRNAGQVEPRLGGKMMNSLPLHFSDARSLQTPNSPAQMQKSTVRFKPVSAWYRITILETGPVVLASQPEESVEKARHA